MTTTIENCDTLVCQLDDDEIERVSGGTSALIHAVAAAAYKVMSKDSYYSGLGCALQEANLPPPE